MRHALQVSSAAGSYPVLIEPGLRRLIGRELADIGQPVGSSVFVVTDKHVAAAGFLDDALTSIESCGFTASSLVIQPGDASKSIARATDLYHAFVQAGMRRDGLVVALGGGVVGDLAGFAAATYMRGIRFVQVPTTLLAHDSAIGGKVGVNLDEAKNLVGAFHAPAAVLFDPECLATLPSSEWRNGMAEVIKHAIIGDGALFAQLAQTPLTDYPDAPGAADLVARAALVKVEVVQADEFESSRRMVLNLGHTIGHAVERLSDYQYGHGEAIAIGMAQEAKLAVQLGVAGPGIERQIESVLNAHDLPTELPPFPKSAFLQTLDLDKKHRADGWTFALPADIGDVRVVHQVPVDAVLQCLGFLS